MLVGFVGGAFVVWFIGLSPPPSRSPFPLRWRSRLPIGEHSHISRDLFEDAPIKMATKANFLRKRKYISDGFCFFTQMASMFMSSSVQRLELKNFVLVRRKISSTLNYDRSSCLVPPRSRNMLDPLRPSWTTTVAGFSGFFCA